MGADGKMTCYEVGGAVRDALLGLPVHDRDWVVVGSTPEALEAAGFLPVGRDFPVFLHPETKEEYALARTERKHGRGYRGFRVHCAPQVTLEEDLQRRDLTINAIARADVLIVGGTSLVVYPAAGLVRYFQGSKLIICNLEPTPQDAYADLVCACDIAAAFDF